MDAAGLDETQAPYALVRRELPVPLHRLPILEAPREPSLVERAPSDSSSSSDSESSCGPHDTTGKCQRPTDASTQSLPIALGIVIPVTIAIIVFVYLHRRHVKRLRYEDAHDKHKSLDFGLDIVPSAGRKGKKKHKGAPEMVFAGGEKSSHSHNRGMSLDMLANPYLLPPGLHGSHESLHSLSRSMHGEDDKYRTANTFTPTDHGSMRSHRGNYRNARDDSSSYTGASSRFAQGDEMNANLLRNAQRMSRSSPPVPDNLPPSQSPQPRSNTMSPIEQTTTPRIASPPPVHLPPENVSETNDPGNNRAGLTKSTDYLGFAIHTGESPLSFIHAASPPPAQSPSDQAPKEAEATNPPYPDSDHGRLDIPQTVITPDPTPVSQPPCISLPLEDDHSDYGDARRSSYMMPPQVNVETADPNGEADIPNRTSYLNQSYDDNHQLDPRRLTMGLRPLPPEDPSDNPEQRANRIRSFYKEYFDESKPTQSGYYGDFDPEAYEYAAEDFDEYPPIPAPYAQPVGRRAMTPPPRMPPRFQSRHQPSASSFGYGPGPGPRAFSSLSGAVGPRAFSSASGRMGPPKKRMPPPAPLHVLPTPHMLKDDSMVLPIDYAPGHSTKDRRAGRPETPLGGLQPYSPNLPSFVPLASSYDDLAAMPSPHMLRKSGTFTALDFAPPPRFKNADTASDSGSIRSNRTGISANHAYNIRTGAYRVSRLPPETVGTKDDITSSLRPKWDMGR